MTIVHKVAVLAAGGLSLLLAGCSANHHSIFRQRALAAPMIVTVDAKQRAFLIAPDALPNGGRGNGAIRACAEPSPDVFSVLAQSIGISGTFGQSANPASTQVAASLAGSSSEQGSTIPRTQTINMLRELMYRTCERYLNRAIGDLEMPIQAVRDQRTMVSILAIEQLTGAVAPNPVVLGASGSAEAGASGAEAVEAMNDAWRALQAEEEAVVTRQAAYNELQGADGACEALVRRSAAGETLTPEDTTKLGQCNERLASLNGAKTRRAAAAQHYEALRTASTLAGTPASAQTEVSEVDLPDNALSRADSESVKEVAEVVREIVMRAYTQDEFLLFCIRTFGNTNARVPPSVAAMCERYVANGIEREAARAEFEARNLRAAARASVTSMDDRRFEQFWGRVAPSGQVDRALLQQVIGNLIDSRRSSGNPVAPDDLAVLERLGRATSRDSASELFRQLSGDALWTALSGGW